MNRYLLFQFDGYYPEGGWHDFVGSYASLDEALAAVEVNADHYQIVDAYEQEIRVHGVSRELRR